MIKLVAGLEVGSKSWKSQRGNIRAGGMEQKA